LDSAGFVGNRRLRDDERDGVLLSVVFDAVRGVEPVVVPVGFEVEVFDAPNVLPEVAFFGFRSVAGSTVDFTLRRVT
jgi:hypothetical protein